MTETDRESVEALKNEIRRSYRASFNATRRAASALLEQMRVADPDHMEGVFIGDMRDEAEAITKSFHEFSAYRNSFDAIDRTLTKGGTDHDK